MNWMALIFGKWREEEISIMKNEYDEPIEGEWREQGRRRKRKRGRRRKKGS